MIEKKLQIVASLLILIFTTQITHQLSSPINVAYAASTPVLQTKEWSKEYILKPPQGAQPKYNTGDGATSVTQTSDNGYALIGQTSNSGDPSGDFWLIKTDPNGQMTWNQTFGGKNQDTPKCIIQTKDNGYAIIGNTLSFGGGIWLIKTDSTGKMIWNKTYVGYRYKPSPGFTYGVDHASSLLQTSDEGFLVAGDTPKNEGSSGLQQDGWLIKTDSKGLMIWNHTYGGPLSEYFNSLSKTNNGDFVLAGSTGSRGLGSGGDDFWLVKVDSLGKMDWNKTYVGPGDSTATAVLQAGDGGYSIAGYISLKSDGGNDFRLVKTDSNGKIEWDETYGGSGNDIAKSMVKATDGYLLVGSTTSYGHSFWAGWLLSTNLSGKALWNQTYSSQSTTMINTITETQGGGYALAGLTQGSDIKFISI